MKKDLDFVISGNKLEIVGLTSDGKAWVETLKPSSRRIKPNSAGYAIKAFKEWQRLCGKTSDVTTAEVINGSNDINDTIHANTVNVRQQSVQTISGSRGFAVSAFILAVLNVLTYIYWIFLRDDFIKNIIAPIRISGREEASSLMNMIDSLIGFPFGSLALFFAMLALPKGDKNTRIMAVVAILIAFVGSWLFKVISHLCLYLTV